MKGRILELEETAFRAWPAADVVDEDGWRVRFTPLSSHRANSVCANACRGRRSLDDRIDAVETFYAARGAPASFQISAAADPPDLDGRLAARGYDVSVAALVETIELSEFRMLGQPPGILTRVTPSAVEEWCSLAVEGGRHAGQREAYLGLLGRIGARAGFAVARKKGVPVAIGLGVLDGEWLGVFDMATVPEARRRRAATAVLGALAAWGSARGAMRVYLQVERDNTPGRALYESAGFRESYPYHFREKR